VLGALVTVSSLVLAHTRGKEAPSEASRLSVGKRPFAVVAVPPVEESTARRCSRAEREDHQQRDRLKENLAISSPISVTPDPYPH
jgi:hypothetical protein